MLEPLYEIVARIILGIHAGLSPLFGKDSGITWALSIVFLTVFMRLLLFPLFVKQIRAQRMMQTLQPKVKELQTKHKGDRETLNREMMALYKEHGANPISGCLPLILQLPVFFALFHVLNYIRPGKVPQYGFTDSLLHSAAYAKVFGAPIAAAFNSPPALLRELDASPTSVKVLSVVLIVLMGLSTFITQKQMMARTGPVDPTQAMTQKILLYVMPFSFAVFGFNFPIGVLLYWLTTNLWSMGQQFFVIRRMPPPPALATAGTAGARPARPVQPTARRPSAGSGTPIGGLFQRIQARLSPAAQSTTRAPEPPAHASDRQPAKPPGSPPGRPAKPPATTAGPPAPGSANGQVSGEQKAAPGQPAPGPNRVGAAGGASGGRSSPAKAGAGGARNKRKGRRGGRR